MTASAGTLEVIPDYFYELEVYPGLLSQLAPDGELTRLITKARADAVASRFRLFETELQRP